jgi:tRNA A37 threonylcarbamoyladenosine dehydratase
VNWFFGLFWWIFLKNIGFLVVNTGQDKKTFSIGKNKAQVFTIVKKINENNQYPQIANRTLKKNNGQHHINEQTKFLDTLNSTEPKICLLKKRQYTVKLPQALFIK